jgi:hypothetical protein
MILRFGSFSTDNGTVALAISKNAALTAAGVPIYVTETWGLEGRLLATSGSEVASLTTKIAELEAAFKQQGVDASLLTEAGGATAHYIRHAETIGGIRVIQPPHYPSGQGADYATFRTFRVGIEADVIANGTVPGYLTFQETLQTLGGGPLYAWTAPIKGSPKRQIPRQQTTYQAVQSGQAVGFLGYPSIPSPIFPGALSANPTITRGSPRRRGSGFMEYPVSWQYVYESNSPLIGVPNAQPFL